MLGWYDFQEGPVTCTGCGWCGPGRDAVMREMFDGGAEYQCPRCSRYFGFVGYPTEAEVRADPRADPVDRAVIARRDERAARFAATKLTSPAQLPPLDPPPAALAWDDVEVAPGEHEVQIRHGERVLWRELGWYGNDARFAEVARILKDRYGDTLQDLVPTERSLTYLLGDSGSADRRIADVRAALASGAPPRPDA